MKHPGPWKAERWCISEPTGGIVWFDSITHELMFRDDEVKRIILAAPETERQRDELLAALKLITSVEGEHCIDHEGESCEAAFANARAIIDRIEQPGKDGE